MWWLSGRFDPPLPVAYSLFDDLHARFTPRAWLARLVGRKVAVPALDEMHE